MILREIDSLPFFYRVNQTTYLVDQEYELLHESLPVGGVDIENGICTVICTNGSRFYFNMNDDIPFYVLRRVHVGFI